MNPNAAQLWPHGRGWLAALLACLSMIGPFSIDTYLPAFSGIAASLNATPVQMQQTLSAYLMGFAVMNLFHGAISDSIGRKPVVLAGMVVFALTSAGCALSESISALVLFRGLQGMCAGAGMVVGRAIIRDMFPPHEAQRVMAQVTIFFGVAPAVAPMIGGQLYVWLGWHSIFWFLTFIGVALLLLMATWLPESLHISQRQPLHVGHLMRGYRQLGGSARFLALVLASGIPFNGMFLYVLSAPVFLGELLHLEPTQFFWFFVTTISGIMGGSYWSGKLAGRISLTKQIRWGFAIMWVVTLTNLACNALFMLSAWWALPLIGLFALGWALMVPVVTILVLEQAPERRGMASSLQSCLSAAANALVAGALAPLVMHSAMGLATAAFGLLLIGSVSWWWVRHKVRLPQHASQPA